MDEPNNILVLDSTKVKCFLDCPRKYYYSYVRHWQPESPSIHLEFGIAWHLAKEHLLMHPDDVDGAYKLFIEHYRKHFTETTDTLFAPKNPEGAMRALLLYPSWAKAHNAGWEVLVTEVAGTVALNEDSSLAFKIDAVVKTPNGIFAVDHKTCSRLTQAWMDSWQVSLQMWTYTYALGSYYGHENVGGALIDGTCFRKNDCEHIRVSVRRSFSQMQSFHWDIQHWVDLINWNHKQFAACSPEDSTLRAFPRNTESCTKYGQCQFFPFCMAWENPMARENPGGFVVREWNPLAEHDNANLKIKV